ncbi:MAG: phosphatidylcholine synthase [Gammaproteobacteria bacterium]|nr:MAG: phosphatidylcholine synthase [Gammaproteobacteria bacterium]UTW42791.1 CDP-alcohol phosphatidyltransferase family protein [bacterium SCSIO 12844]
MKYRLQKLYAYLIHVFTSLGAVLGVLTLFAISKHQYELAFLYIAISIIVDAVDGSLARMVDIKALAKIDGALLDNIIDFLNYAVVPAYFIMIAQTNGSVPHYWKIPCMVMIIMAACYQFTQVDAKTDDHFFKGFPSYWNIVIFYLFYWQLHPITNVFIIVILTIFSFIPIKYIYPSRMTHLSKNKYLVTLMFIATIIWGIATILLLVTYPKQQLILNGICIGYILLYFAVSVYRTLKPLKL